MIKEVRLTEKEMTEPYGYVYCFPANYDEKDIMHWNKRHSMYMYEGSETDYEHIIAEDLSVIKKGFCRICKNKIKHYDTKYFRKELRDGTAESFEHSEKSDYCKECAKELCRTAKIINYCGSIKKSFWRQDIGGEYLSHEVFEDGSELTEMTFDEKVRAGVI